MASKSKGKTRKAALAVPMNHNVSKGVTVREIENGYIMEQYTSGPKAYTRTETFSPTKPKVEITVKPAKK